MIMMMMTMKTMEIVIKAYVYFPSDSCTNGLCRSQTRGVISLEGASSHIKYNCLLNKYNIHFFCGMFLCVGKAKQLSRFISSNKCIISASSHIKYNCLSNKYIISASCVEKVKQLSRYKLEQMHQPSLRLRFHMQHCRFRPSYQLLLLASQI